MSNAAVSDRGQKPPLWAPGIALGAVGAAAMTGVSLFPKDPKLQAIGIPIAALAYAGVGMGTEALAGHLDGSLGGDHLRAELAIGGTGAALAAGLAVATRGKLTGPLGALQTAGKLAAFGGAAGAACTLATKHDDKVPGGELVAQGAVAAVAGAAMLGAMKFGALRAGSREIVMPDLPELAVDAKKVGQLAIDRDASLRGLVTSGDAGTPLSWDRQSGQGKRFLTEMPHADEIRNVMRAADGSEPQGIKDPARIYASLKHADPKLGEHAAAMQRVDRVMEDAERLKVFGEYRREADGTLTELHPPRKHMMVALTTSNGFVNPVAASSFEFMHGGDTAIMAIQAGKKPALGELHHVERSTATNIELLTRLKARLDQMPEGAPRPKVHLYGESFGAWVGQNIVRGTGEGRLSLIASRIGKWDGKQTHVPDAVTPAMIKARYEELGIDGGAMFVGTPKFSGERPVYQSAEELATGAKPASLHIRNLLEAREITPEQANASMATYVQHDSDPVALFEPGLLVHKAPFLGRRSTRGENISPQQTDMPIVTALQTAFDQQKAQYFKQGVNESKGHDYRSTVPYAMRTAYKRHDIPDGSVGRIREWNRQLEVIHAAHQKAAAAARAGANTKAAPAAAPAAALAG
jgi:hypothetical protein